LRTVPASMTKFWPQAFVGRTPAASATSRTRAGVSRAGAVVTRPTLPASSPGPREPVRLLIAQSYRRTSWEGRRAS
jgi:hypothetical protein